MAERPIGVTDVASGAGVVDYRTRERTVSASTVVEQYVVPVAERVASFKGMAATFRMPAATVGQPLAYLFNQPGSGVLVAVRRLMLVVSNTASTALNRALIVSPLTAEPTGGTAHTAVPFDTAQTGSSGVVFKGAASSDGTANAITATLGTPAVSLMAARLASAVGQALPVESPALPGLSATDPPVLREGQGLLISYNPVDTPSTVIQHIVNVMWEEFTLP